MKQVGNYNKLPASLSVPPLKKGQYVLYRLLDPVVDKSDPRNEKLIWPKAKKIPTLDVIKDPATGMPIEIGCVDRVDKDGMPTIKTFWVRGMENNGYFSLTGGQGNDDYYHWLFELSNYNLSNPNRDPTVTPIFQRIDRVVDAKRSLKKRDELLDVMIYIRDMEEKDIRLVAASLNWDDKEDIDILRDKVAEFAQKDPKKFSQLARSKDIEMKAVIKRAHDLEIIKYNVQQNKVVWASNGDTIASLPRIEGMDWISNMADWVLSSKNGDKTYDAIKKQVNKAPEPA